MLVIQHFNENQGLLQLDGHRTWLVFEVALNF